MIDFVDAGNGENADETRTFSEDLLASLEPSLSPEELAAIRSTSDQGGSLSYWPGW